MPAVPLFTSSTWIALRRERADRRHRRRRQAGEPDVVKNYPSSFEKTNLDDLLKGFGVEEVTLAGCMTHVCVNSTARAAFNHGYRATVVGNATATRSLPNPAGGVVSAKDLHDASLAALHDIFAVVVPAADDVTA